MRKRRRKKNKNKKTIKNQQVSPRRETYLADYLTNKFQKGTC